MEALQRLHNRGSVSTGYDIDNSLKVESDNREYLRWTNFSTYASSARKKKFSMSLWCKRTEISSQQIIWSTQSNGYLSFEADDEIFVSGSALLASEGDDSDIGRGAIRKLMDVVDKFIVAPERDTEKNFLMPVEDVFTITGRGTVCTGRIERGIVNTGDIVDIIGLREKQTTTITGIEMFRKILDEGQAGDNAGLLLRGTKREEVERGQVICKQDTVNAHHKFECKTVILSEEEGGRKKPFKGGYRPQFYFRTTDVTGEIQLVGSERKMVLPGDMDVDLEVTLIKPVAIENELRFAIREGGRTVGAGQVTKIIE